MNCIIDKATSSQVILIMPIGYLISIVLFKKFMTNRSPYQFKYFMQIYNILQITLNLYMINGLYILPWLSNTPNLFGINSLYDKNIQYYVFIHYLSKYLDYFDTFFMISKKNNRQLTFLHIYHHTTIGMIWGFIIRIGHGNGTAAFGCLINSVIHAIMYSHYLYTSFGWNNPFKKYITQVQLLQFLLCIIHSIFCTVMGNGISS